MSSAFAVTATLHAGMDNHLEGGFSPLGQSVFLCTWICTASICAYLDAFLVLIPPSPTHVSVVFPC
jgi:hypothetical protein